MEKCEIQHKSILNYVFYGNQKGYRRLLPAGLTDFSDCWTDFPVPVQVPGWCFPTQVLLKKFSRVYFSKPVQVH